MKINCHRKGFGFNKGELASAWVTAWPDTELRLKNTVCRGGRDIFRPPVAMPIRNAISNDAVFPRFLEIESHPPLHIASYHPMNTTFNT
jgi:hypothetical protein